MYYFIVCNIALWNLKCKCERDTEAKKNCKAMTLDEKKIIDKLYSGLSTSAVGLTFH